MATTSKATSWEERALRKRLNARVRQQRCRARKREETLVKKIGLAQQRSNQVHKNLLSSSDPQHKSMNPTRQVDPHSRHPTPHFHMPFHPAMQFCGPPMRHGMGFPPMMPPPHMMMAMRMGGPMPPMSMPGRHFMGPPMSPSRPMTVSRTVTEESSEGSPPKDAPKGGVKPSPKTEAAIFGMLSLRSSSSSDSDSEEDSSTPGKKDEFPLTTLPTSSKKPAKKRPVTVCVPADDSANMRTSQVTASPMPWPVGLDGPSAMMRPSAAVPA
jgi:hypothetical protein